MRDKFDLDQSNPNPYVEVDNCKSLFYINIFSPNQSSDVTMAQLKLELLKEEARDFVGPGPPPKVSPGAFFKKVIEIESRQ